MKLLEANPQTAEPPKPLATQSATPLRQRGPGSRRKKLLLTITGFIALGIAFLPTLICSFGYGTKLLQRSQPAGTLVEAESVSVGWFSPLVAHGIQIKKPSQKEGTKIEKLEVNKSLLDMVRDKMKNATVTLKNPKFRIVLDDGGKSAGALFPRMRTKIVDGELRVFETNKDKEPKVFLEKLNFTSNVKDIKGGGRQMSIRSTTILDRYKLTPELTDKGLGFVAPLLANATDVEGAVSLRIEELTVDRVNDQSKVKALRGSVVLHDVRAEAGPVADDLLDILGYMLRRDIPKRALVAKESTVDFYLKKDRIYHEGFAFVLPEVAPKIELRSAGSVGVDETLDVTLSLVVPESLADALPMMRGLVGKPVEVKVGGTISEPRIGLPNDQGLAEYVASRLVPTEGGNPEELPAAIIRLVEGVASPVRGPNERVQTLPGTIMNLIRSVRETRRQRLESGQARPPRQRRLPRRRRRLPNQ
ncbi:MAG: hypothetical protein AB8G99_12270 [Planctomycetaceae bacterium]